MNAIDMLEDDHEKVKGLLEELAKTTPRAAKRRTELLQKIAMEFEVHATLEEEIFYPAFHQVGESAEDEKMFFEALEEHRAVRDLVLPDLLDTDVTSDQFSGRAKVLKDLILHHAEEEEEELFPRAKELLEAELEPIGLEMKERKATLTKELSAATGRPRRRQPTGLEVRG
jgi:hemerythrin-like domain-containing protein